MKDFRLVKSKGLDFLINLAISSEIVTENESLRLARLMDFRLGKVMEIMTENKKEKYLG